MPAPQASHRHARTVPSLLTQQAGERRAWRACHMTDVMEHLSGLLEQVQARQAHALCKLRVGS
jgi:hypothetical protein